MKEEQENKYIRLEGETARNDLSAHQDTTALSIEFATLDSLDGLASYSNLEDLRLIAVRAPSLEVLSTLSSLRRLIIIGCPFDDASPLLNITTLHHCIFRAIPWSKESWREVLPVLQARADVNCELPQSSGWSMCRSANRVLGVCAEPYGDKQVAAVYSGDKQESGEAIVVLPRRDFKILVTRSAGPDALRELITNSGQSGSTWLDSVTGATPTGASADEILDTITQLAISPEELQSLTTYVKRFAQLRFAEQPDTHSYAPADSPMILRALMNTIGRWQVARVLKVRFGQDDEDDNLWWEWYPSGAWKGSDPGLEGKYICVAINLDLEQGLWVEASPDSKTAVWRASIAEHEPGHPIDTDTMVPFASSLAGLLEALDAVQLPDGTILEEV